MFFFYVVWHSSGPRDIKCN